MDDFLAAIPVTEISFPTIILLVIVAIIRGDLVPRKVLTAATEERDHWRGVALSLLDTNDRLAKTADVTAAVVDAHPKPLPEVAS